MIEMIATDEYADLLQKYRPAVPQNPEEHSRLVAVLEDLELSGRILNPEEVQFADLVSALVLHYENVVCPMREVPALEMLRHLVETRGLRQSDFVPVLGSKSYVNQIFTGHRSITRGVAEKLGQVLRVSSSVFRAG